MKRAVRGFLEAKECERPKCIPLGRPRGAKAEGLRYERALLKAIGPSARGGCWFSFSDSEGQGFCQTDILLLKKDVVYVLECKLSWTEEAEQSLRRLYLPIVQAVFGRPARGIVCCENLRRGMPWTTRVVGSLDEAIASAAWPGGVVLHWRRKTPLFLRGMRDAA